MITVIAIGGEPATGKTTLMRALLEKLQAPQKFETGGVSGYISRTSRAVVLGLYAEGEKFAGTDRFAMNIQPKAERFLFSLAASSGFDGYIVYYEGDRIFNGKMFDFLKDKGIAHKIYVLESGEQALKMRHALREDTQNETWLRGRKTKIETIRRGRTCEVRQHNTIDDTVKIVDELTEKLQCAT